MRTRYFVDLADFVLVHVFAVRDESEHLGDFELQASDLLQGVLFDRAVLDPVVGHLDGDLDVFVGLLALLDESVQTQP